MRRGLFICAYILVHFIPIYGVFLFLIAPYLRVSGWVLMLPFGVLLPAVLYIATMRCVNCGEIVYKKGSVGRSFPFDFRSVCPSCGESVFLKSVD